MSARGVACNHAIDQGSTWGTEVAAGAGDGIWLEEVTVSRTNREFLEDRSMAGTVYGNKGDAGARMFEGTLRGRLRYGYGIPRLIAAAFGTSGAPTGSDPYTHALTLTDQLAKFFTLVRRASVGATPTAVFQTVPSFMVERLTIRGRGAEPCTVEAGILGSNFDRDSSTNDATSWANVTMTGVRNSLLVTDGRFRLNAQAGGALDTPDVLKPMGFELSIVRTLSRDHLMDTGLAGKLSQPVDAGPVVVTLMLEFARYGAASSYITDFDSFADAYDAGTEYKADVLFDDPNGSGSIQFDFPRLQVVSDIDPAVSGEGLLPHRVTLRGLEASSAPTGMSGVTKPVHGTIVDGLSGAYLS